MNTRQRQTLHAIFTDPVSATIPWRAVESLFQALGGEVTEGNGSRVRVALNGRRAVFHRPHPEPTCPRYVVRNVREFLMEAGIRPMD
jgi:hypothetical protein